jgi:hypothetical protein
MANLGHIDKGSFSTIGGRDEEFHLLVGKTDRGGVGSKVTVQDEIIEGPNKRIKMSDFNEDILGSSDEE